MDLLRIGKTSLQVPPLGVGTWAWGDQAVWNYGKGYGESDLAQAFQVSLEAGITFFDTAEIYGRGASEQLLGTFAKGKSVTIATKYMPRPIRGAATLETALDRSLQRLQRPSVELYQIHWPPPWVSNARLMSRLARTVQSGKATAVGVSNYSAKQLRKAHASLAASGVVLASNQIEYSLLHRKPELNGVADVCGELGVTLIAYSPLAMGALSGKYGKGRRPGGARNFVRAFRGRNLERAERLIALLGEIAQRKNATHSLVALRWIIDQGALVIPGAKNATQAKENARALGLTLTAAERDELERESRPWRR